MSIQSELARIKGAKADLQSWVEENGVTVPDGTLIDGLVELAKTVETGGGGSFDLSNFLQNITDVISFSFTPTSDEGSYVIDKPSTNSIPRMGFVYADDISYAYNKSILAFWLYTAVDPYTDVSSGANLQVHFYTNNSTAIASRVNNAFLLGNGSALGCLQSNRTSRYIIIKSQTAANNKALFKAGVQYNGFVFFGD